MLVGNLADQCGECDGGVGSDLVPGNLGQLGVAGEVGEGHGFGALRCRKPQARLLQRGLDVLDLVRGHVRFGVAPEQPAQQVLARGADPHAHVAYRGFVGCVVAEPAPAEPLLDGGVEVVRQVLRHPPCAFAPDPSHAHHVILSEARIHEDAQHLQDGHVLFPHALIRVGPPQAERDIGSLEGLICQAELTGQLAMGDSGARVAATGTLEIAELQVARREGRCQVLRRDAQRLEIGDRAGTHDVTPGESARVRLEDAQPRELPDALGARTTAGRQVFEGQALRALAGGIRERVAACLRAEPVLRPVVLGARHRVVRVDPHAADRIGHHRHGAHGGTDGRSGLLAPMGLRRRHHRRLHAD